MTREPEPSGEAPRKKKRLRVVELYRRTKSGRLEPTGAVVAEYSGERRGGSVRRER